MVLGGVAFAILALPVVLLKAKTYDASVTLLISPPTFKDRPKPANPRDPAALQETISDMMPRALPVETYKIIALSPPVLDEVIRRVPLEEMGVKALEMNLEVELVQMGSRSASTGIMYSQAILFRAKAHEPETAAKISQTWAEVFKEQVDETAATGIGETFALLDTLHNSTKTAYEQSDLALAEHQKQWNLDLIKAQIDSKQKEYTAFEGTLKQTEVNLIAGEKKLAALEAELANEPEKLVLFRAPSDDAYWIAGLDSQSKSKEAPDKGLRTEEMNPNHIKIRASVVEAKESIEGLRATKDTILVKLDELKKEMDALTVTLADQTVERNKLMRESESLKETYSLVRAEYEKGRMADQTRASDIVIAGNAVVPDVPSSPSNPKLVIAATMLGMLLTGAFLVAKEISDTVQQAQNARKQTAAHAAVLPGGAPENGPVDIAHAGEERANSGKGV
jgi:capsular polysaccharide biosynthesis protein